MTFTSSGISPHPAPGPLVVGVDVGGTKIAVGIVDVQGQVYGRVKIPTDISEPQKTLQCIANGVNAAIAAAEVDPVHIRGVGVGIPGKVDAEQGIGLLAVNLGWHNVPVKSWLEETLKLPCTIENDVSAATLGESIYGVGKGLSNMVYLSLGTGIAARVIIEGQLYRGNNGMAGELGHVIFAPDGPLCRCGGHGCLEALAAGPALIQHAKVSIQMGEESLLQHLLAESAEPTADLIFQAAAQEDRLAQQILTEAASHLAYAIYLLAMTFDPQIIVLGGGLALQDGPYITAIRRQIAHWKEQSPIFRELLAPEEIQLSGLQRDSAILGAAALITRSNKQESSHEYTSNN